MIMRAALASVLAAMLLVAMPVHAAPVTAATVVQGMAAHRARYDLSLAETNGTVVGANGTMSFEMADACDGWASRQRLQMSIENRDAQPVEMVSDYATFESKDGKHLTFRMRQMTNQAITTILAGEATLDKPFGSGEVHYTLPKDSHMKLPAGTVFPTWHTASILAAAINGQRFITLPLFDGTSPDGAQLSSVVITAWDKTSPNAPFPALTELPSGRVHVAFFSPTDYSGQPDYEVGMRYWANGVADSLRMDFGNFVMAGKLTKFAILPPHC